MEKLDLKAVQDPRDQESSLKPHEEGVEQEQRQPEEQESGTPTAIPDADNGDTVNPLQEPDSNSSGFKKENLIKVKNEDEEEEEEKDEDIDEDNEEMDGEEEEDVDEEENEIEEDDNDKEPGRDTASRQPGDDFSSPANPDDTNFEDPAQNRKTDPMTDHESRIAGI